MVNKINSLKDLFVYLLSDIYKVENRLIEELPMLMDRASSEELRDGISHHLIETKEQVKRLDKIFKLIKEQPKDVEWVGNIENLFSNANQFLTQNTQSAVLDAAIIAIAQRIEHFEIATYGTLREFAKVLRYDEVSDLLKDNIKEEGHADKLLTKLAKGGFFKEGINVSAAS